MGEIPLSRLRPESLLDCGFEYRKMYDSDDEGTEEYFVKIPGIIIDSHIRCETEDNKSWYEVSLIYHAYVADSPFCETCDNFYSEFQGIYLRAITMKKRENYKLKLENKPITEREFIMAGASVIASLPSISEYSTDHDLFAFIEQLGRKLDLSQYNPETKRSPWSQAPPNYF